MRGIQSWEVHLLSVYLLMFIVAWSSAWWFLKSIYIFPHMYLYQSPNCFTLNPECARYLLFTSDYCLEWKCNYSVREVLKTMSLLLYLNLHSYAKRRNSIVPPPTVPNPTQPHCSISHQRLGVHSFLSHPAYTNNNPIPHHRLHYAFRLLQRRCCWPLQSWFRIKIFFKLFMSLPDSRKILLR